MTDETRFCSIDEFDLSVRAFELLQSLEVQSVGQLLDLPRIPIPADWPRGIAQRVAEELLELCNELGLPYEGELIVPPPTPAALQANGTVMQRWEVIRTWLEAEHPEALDHFRPGASAEAIKKAEAALDVTLPEDYQQFLALHDGQEQGAPMVGHGSLLPIGEVVEAHRNLDGEATPIDPEGVGEGVRAVDYSEQWIPISRSARGRDYLCIDLDPAPGGVTGQIIEYVVDGDQRRLIAKRFADLLSLYFEQAQTGDLDLTTI